MASSFLEKLAKEQAEKIDKAHGASAYGGTSWLNKQLGGNTDIAPIKKEETKNAEQSSGWLQAGALDDKEKPLALRLAQAPLATIADLREGLWAGMLSIGESLSDAGAVAFKYLSDAALRKENYSGNLEKYAGMDKDEADKFVEDAVKKKGEAVGQFVAQDLYDEEAIAKKILAPTQYPLKQFVGGDIESASIMGEKADNLAVSGGQLIGQVTANTIAPGSGMALMAATSFGSEVENALRNGATLDEATTSGLISAVAEVLTERLGGISFGGKTLTDAATDAIAKRVSGKFVKYLLGAGKFLSNGGAESLEELASGYISAWGQQLTYMSDKEIEELFSNEAALDAAIGGFVLGSFGETGDIANSVATGEDYVTGLTKNEQKVLDKLVADEIAEAEKNGKVTSKQKEEIRDKNLTKMEKGYVSIDEIESVLGGETYKAYKETLDRENALTERQEALQKELDDINNSPWQERDWERIDEIEAELAEINPQVENNKANSKLGDIRKQLGDEVFQMTVKDKRLRESYNEALRKYQQIDIDPTQYSGAARKTAESIVNAKWNNTNVAKDAANLLIRVSEGQGIPIEALTAKEIAERGFGVEGKTVNGANTKDGIIINWQSKKYLNTTVGHEITHVLKKSGLYEPLRDAMKGYSEAKGDYQTRYDSTKDLYIKKDKDGNAILDADGNAVYLTEDGKVDGIEEEVIADLVGDYLFTDQKFVDHLLSTDENVFKKVWNEVKYFVKISTAGSEEHGKLIEAQRAFERAYKNRGKNPDAQTTTGTQTKAQHSLGEIVDEDGNSYGIGVLLDSTLLDDLSESERVEMVKEYVKELGGSTLKAYDKDRNPVDIVLVEPNRKFKNKSGKNVPVLRDMTNYLASEVKQEAIALIDELVLASNYNGKEPARHPHDWVDNNGANDWDVWTTYIKDKKNTVWEATLRIANSANGEKILYDIFPIKKAEGVQTMDIATTEDSVPQNGNGVKGQFSLNAVTEAQNEKGLNMEQEVSYSISRDTEYSDAAIALNDASKNVDATVLDAAKRTRSWVADRLREMQENGVALPPDIEGDTWFEDKAYGGSMENTLVCPRSLAPEAFMDAVSKTVGRPLTVKEQIYVSQELMSLMTTSEELRGQAFLAQCVYCYVAADRMAQREFLGEYIKQRDAVLEKIANNPNVDVSQLESDHAALAQWWENKKGKKPVLSEVGKLYQEFLKKRKPTGATYERFKMWVEAYTNGSPMIDGNHLASIEELTGDLSQFDPALIPQIKDAWKYAQSASWAKKRTSYTAYNGQILEWDDDLINALNEHYGMRMYSFSDYHPAFVLENMQMITDAAVRGLKTLAYTKDLDFAEIFAPSHANINISTFGFEKGGNVYEDNQMGADWKKAQALRAKYPNVGITFVATNDTITEWALQQDWIDVVIPYHMVKTGKIIADYFGYKNYTKESSDKKTSVWRKDKAWKESHDSSIAPTGHNNDLETYLAALEANGLKPRFERFLKNPATRPYYMKLVNECRLSASMSRAVEPKFDENAIQRTLARLETEGYYTPIGGSVERMYEIAAGVAENIPVQNSLSEIGEQPVQHGDWNISGEDLALQEIAPVDSSVGNVEDEHPTAETADVESLAGDRDSFMSQKAMELYKEITSLKKGVRASKRLGYLLDHGHEWRSIKTALLNIRDNPNQVVNPNSAAEAVAREMLGREYDDMVAELAEPSDVAGKIRNKMQHIQTEIANNERLREQSNMDYDQEIAEVQAEYDAKKNKNTIVANDLLRRIERLNRMKNTNDDRYAKRIGDLEARLEKMRQPTYKRAVQRRAKHDEYTNLMKNLVGDTTHWVDKKLGISYKVNTLRRNLRDVVRDANGNRDIAKADAIYDELQGKYNHNEAELKRESMRIKKVFADLKLNHAEDTYAHMLGEFQSNPDSKLTEEAVKEYYEANKGKIDTKKVDKAIEESRKVFDELIVRVNERLKEQGMKEIPYRKGYFPHFTNPKQGWLAKLLNWKTVDTEIPTSIAGLTETFNPERSWQGFSKQRKGDTTDYSLEQGLDTYIHGALDWIYHIEDIQKRRALENHIRYVHSEEGVKARVDAINKSEELDADEAQRQIDAVYAEANNPLNNFVTNLRAGTNTLANKKSENDRQMESDTNRKIYSVMTNLNNRISANMVVGSFSSALTNFIPITQSWMEVSPVYSLKGMKDTIKSTIRDDGMVNKSDFLTNRLRNEENLYQTTWDKISDKAAIMMEAIDSFTSQTVWRSKYLQNISEGMSETEAIKNADQFAENVIAGRSRGNQPTIFDAKNPITKIFTAFQLEVSNQYGYMFKDVPQDSKNKARLIKGYATAFLGAYVYNALYSSLTGRDAAFDPIGILEDLFRDMGLFGDDEEEEPKDVILNLTDNIIEEAPFVGGLMGGGRIPISSALPYSGEYGGLEALLTDVSDGNYESFAKEMLKPLYYLALPFGGGQIKKTAEGLGMFSDDHPVAGSYTDSGNLRFPVEDTFGNRLQAGLFGQYASENARDYFDNGRSPLKEKQIQEYIDVDIPIRDYWDYREGLADQKTIEDKFDYIAGLDLPVSKKNILINNVVDREEKVDLEGYEDFSSYDEFDFATKKPGEYAVSQVVGGYDAYTSYMDAIGDITADKDENGKSISGSRKEKVIKYINNMDLDYGQKIILFKSEYEADDTYNKDIVEYLNSRKDISYEEMKTILEELGAKVDSKGYIKWD